MPAASSSIPILPALGLAFAALLLNYISTRPITYSDRRSIISKKLKLILNDRSELKELQDVEEIEEVVECVEFVELGVGRGGEGFVVLTSVLRGEVGTFKIPLKTLNPIINSILTSKITTTTYCFQTSTLPTPPSLLPGYLHSITPWSLSFSHLTTLNYSKISLTETLKSLIYLQTLTCPKPLKRELQIIPLPISQTSTLLPFIFSIYPHEKYVCGYASGTLSCSNLNCSTSFQPIVECENVNKSELSSLGDLECFNELESWGTSLLAVLKLKRDTEMSIPTDETKEEKKSRRIKMKTNVEFTPFMLNYGYLLEGEDEEMCLKNLHHYVTGKKGVNPDYTIINDFRKMVNADKFKGKTKDQIHDVIFSFKYLLLNSKILQDTVLPRENWSLKSNRKLVGCACCVVESDSDSDDEGGWIDGKGGFAFDPGKAVRRRDRMVERGRE